MPIPQVITLATLKGGSGKSTLAAGLAMHWHEHQETPALIDADPHGRIMDPMDPRANIAALTVQAGPGESVGALVNRLKKHHKPIIIDTPDLKSAATIESLAASDLVLVPLRPTPADVQVALLTRHLIDEVNATPARAGRPIAVRFVFTMTVPKSEIARQVRIELRKAGFHLLKAEYTDCEAQRGIASIGTRRSGRQRTGAAAQDIPRIAMELENLEL